MTGCNKGRASHVDFISVSLFCDSGGSNGNKLCTRQDWHEFIGAELSCQEKIGLNSCKYMN
jgi:hypothetical protein